MTTKHLIALGEIIGVKDARQIATGETDADGAPVFRIEAAPILPGEAFTADAVTAAMLIRNRAAAPAGSEEAVLRAQESRG